MHTQPGRERTKDKGSTRALPASLAPICDSKIPCSVCTHRQSATLVWFGRYRRIKSLYLVPLLHHFQRHMHLSTLQVVFNSCMMEMPQWCLSLDAISGGLQ